MCAVIIFPVPSAFRNLLVIGDVFVMTLYGHINLGISFAHLFFSALDRT